MFMCCVFAYLCICGWVMSRNSYICIFVLMCVCVCVSFCVYIHAFRRVMYVCVRACVDVWMWVWECACACACACVHVYINVCTRAYEYMSTYIHIIQVLSKAPYHPSVLKCLAWVRGVQAAEKAQLKSGRKRKRGAVTRST